MRCGHRAASGMEVRRVKNRRAGLQRQPRARPEGTPFRSHLSVACNDMPLFCAESWAIALDPLSSNAALPDELGAITGDILSGRSSAGRIFWAS